MNEVTDENTPVSHFTWSKFDLLMETIGKKPKAERKAFYKNLRANAAVEKVYVTEIDLKLNG